MNDLIAATVPQDLRDFTTLVAGNPADVGARICRQAAAGFGAGPGPDDDRVAALEAALDRDDAGGQQARAALQRSGRAVIDDDRAGGIDRARDPRLSGRARLATWQK